MKVEPTSTYGTKDCVKVMKALRSKRATRQEAVFRHPRQLWKIPPGRHPSLSTSGEPYPQSPDPAAPETAARVGGWSGGGPGHPAGEPDVYSGHRQFRVMSPHPPRTVSARDRHRRRFRPAAASPCCVDCMYSVCGLCLLMASAVC